jgi:hypothetical protein
MVAQFGFHDDCAIALTLTIWTAEQYQETGYISLGMAKFQILSEKNKRRNKMSIFSSNLKLFHVTLSSSPRMPYIQESLYFYFTDNK